MKNFKLLFVTYFDGEECSELGNEWTRIQETSEIPYIASWNHVRTWTRVLEKLKIPTQQIRCEYSSEFEIIGFYHRDPPYAS